MIRKLFATGILAAVVLMGSGIVSTSFTSSTSAEAAFGPGISRTPTGISKPPSSTNPGPCITLPSGRVYCGS